MKEEIRTKVVSFAARWREIYMALVFNLAAMTLLLVPRPSHAGDAVSMPAQNRSGSYAVPVATMRNLQSLMYTDAGLAISRIDPALGHLRHINPYSRSDRYTVGLMSEIDDKYFQTRLQNALNSANYLNPMTNRPLPGPKPRI